MTYDNEEVECKTHPCAPHGFLRNASHTEDRYVCECEYWQPERNCKAAELQRKIEDLKYEMEKNAYDWNDYTRYLIEYMTANGYIDRERGFTFPDGTQLSVADYERYSKGKYTPYFKELDTSVERP